ncbi:MAG: hypothetical protein HY698_10940 [Deltaproteobacteria bacterium]|nr:hypothetical protein [Deltaproteobacteria bacterium]
MTGSPDASRLDASVSVDAGGCLKHEDCDDRDPCNGVETCSLARQCEPAAPPNAHGIPCDADQNPSTRDLCVEGVCTPTRCGDGIVDAENKEDCDDANETEGDGCDSDCTLSCSGSDECRDENSCNGTESCDTEKHSCRAGTPLENGTSCGTDLECHQGTCRPVGCGDGVQNSGEECDDGNSTDGDGCDSDCSYSCKVIADCVDGNPCNGEESCDTATHKCVAGNELDCSDTNACTKDTCDPVTGCQHPLIDGDNDGHADVALGTCGDDCNDNRGDVHKGAPEACDGVDNDCNGDIDENKPIWYIDCDKDGYAPASAVNTPVASCEAPPASQTGCNGGWTTRRPFDAATTDCRDSNATVRPNQTAFQTTAIAGASSLVDYDYNCDGTEEKQYTATGISSSAKCTGDLSSCSRTGLAGWTSATAPSCGVQGDYTSCYWTLELGGMCVRGTSKRTQACR